MKFWVVIVFLMLSCKPKFEILIDDPGSKVSQPGNDDLSSDENGTQKNPERQVVSVDALNEFALANTRLIEQTVSSSTQQAPQPNPAQNLEDFGGILESAQYENSDLVFRGTTTKVEYLQSNPGQISGNKIPLTLVTFKIDEVIKGTYKEPTITVRFVGGWNKEKTTFMVGSNQPIFVVGDQDILLLKDNGKSLSPIVKKGRLPIDKGLVYTWDSRKVEIGENGRLMAGEQANIKSILERRVSSTMVLASEIGNGASARGDKDENGQPVENNKPTKLGSHAKIDAFTKVIKSLPGKFNLSSNPPTAEVKSVQNADEFNVDEILTPVAPQ